jgi:hypothetical protein
MNRSPAGEETLVFIGYMRVSKADGSQVVDLQRDALAVTGCVLRRSQTARLVRHQHEEGLEAAVCIRQVVRTGFRRCDARGAM